MTVEECARWVVCQAGDAYSCSPASLGGIRVETPMLFPDGDVVDVFVFERGGGLFVTDLGEALGSVFRMTGVDGCSPKQESAIRDLCRRSGIEFRRSELKVPVNTCEDLGDAIVRLAGLVARVADLLLSSRGAANPGEPTDEGR